MKKNFAIVYILIFSLFHPKENFNVGDFVNVKINDCTSATLVGKATGFSKNN